MCTFPHSWKFNTNIQYGSHFGLTIGDLWRLRWEAQQLKAVESSASKPVTMVGCAGRQKNNIEREPDSDGRRRKHRANRIYMYAIFMSTIRSCRAGWKQIDIDYRASLWFGVSSLLVSIDRTENERLPARGRRYVWRKKKLHEKKVSKCKCVFIP